jgi:hypothetical protein
LFLADQRRQFTLVLQDQRMPAHQHGGALLCSQRPPAGQGGAGGLTAAQVSAAPRSATQQ